MKNDLVFPFFNLSLQIEKRPRFSVFQFVAKLKNGLVFQFAAAKWKRPRFQFVATVPYLDLLQVRFNVLGGGAGTGRSIIN